MSFPENPSSTLQNGPDLSAQAPTLAGVFPVLATPFLPDGTPDEAGLVAIVRYVLDAGADGVVFPGVASECESLSVAERMRCSTAG